MLRLFTRIILWSLLIVTPAFATDHYFDNGSPDNTLPCTLADPCDNMRSTTLDNANAIACGDTINLKRGDVWEGSEAEFIVNSGTTSCSSNPIYVQAYGTGANPVLYGAPVTSSGWSVFSGNIYVNSATQSQTHLKTVVYNSTDTTAENYKGLFYWSGATSTLPTGTFKRSSNLIYVNLGGADPATSNVRIGNYAHTTDGNGSRGLLSSGTRSGGATYGHYVRFRDIDIVGANGVGYSTSGSNAWDANLLIIGAGSDGWLAYKDATSSLESGENYRSYGTHVKYSAAGVHGAGGSGQGWTTYAPYGWWVWSRSEYNAMAGYDWLNFGPSTVVTEAGCFWCYATDNGIAPTDPSYDGNYYNDGGYRIFIYGSRSHRNGIGTGTAGNARTGGLGGSEHPTSDPTYDTYWVNNWFDTTFYIASGSDNSTSSTANLTGFHWYYNTIVAYRGGSQSWGISAVDWDTTISDNYHVKNNILYAENSGAVNNRNITDTADWLDWDYNQVYKQGGADTAYRVTGSSIASFRSVTGEAANDNFADPLFVDDNETGGLDVTLQGGSPAIDRGVVNPYTVPSWLPTTVKDYLGTAGIRGSTIAAGTEDNYATAPDAGYHGTGHYYGDLTSVNIEPASLTTSSVGNIVVTFTVPDIIGGWIPMDGKVKITLPSGFSWSSGSASAVTSSTISGTWTFSSSGQVGTFTRVGDGNSEFPGTYTMTISNVAVTSTPGVSGAYAIETQQSDGTVIAGDDSVEGDTFTSQTTGAHLSCSGKFLSTGKWSVR